MPCSPCSVLLGWLAPNMMGVPEMMISGPPMSPRQAARRGTRPVQGMERGSLLYVRRPGVDLLLQLGSQDSVGARSGFRTPRGFALDSNGDSPPARQLVRP